MIVSGTPRCQPTRRASVELRLEQVRVIDDASRTTQRELGLGLSGRRRLMALDQLRRSNGSVTVRKMD